MVEEPLRKWTKWTQDWSDSSGEEPRIPVLRIEDGESETVLPESNQINLFLDSHFGEREYTPEMGSEAYKQMEVWWRWCAEELKPTIDLYKYGKDLVFDHDAHVAHTLELRTYLQKLETYLSVHSYLVNGRLTLADIAIIPFIRQIMRTREGEFDFTDFPHVEKWTREIIDTEWFQTKVMKKYPLATAGNAV